ncbi:reverse transcriptase [Labeo rohita]|uniref:Reverse transcriptase n=1 Tax=Labeo rohita TaxID=84645 RepID=A0A498N2A9_LABRO|nr:reverse transcriptase [Labeo rohita]RXN36317.1 reverse transcriptase [Labeo rohita]
MVLKKGKVSDRFRFALGETTIPSVTEKPVKSLGKIFDSFLKDSAAIKQTKRDLTIWLTAIDKSGLSGKFKAWIYQHGVLPRLLWPLSVYEVPTSTVEALEKSISQFLRRWLGLPRSLSSIALYGHSTKLHLPLSGLSEEFKVARSREVLMYRDSRDTKVTAAGILVKTGRKWQAQEAVTKAEVQLRHKTLVGSVATGRVGFGCFPRPRYDLARGKREVQTDSGRDTSRGGGRTLHQNGRHVQTRSVDQVGTGRSPQNHLGRALESRATLDQVPCPIRLRRPPKPSQPAHLGPGRHS